MFGQNWSRYLPMTPISPNAAEAKSKFITNFVGGPNTECAGNSMFPVWTGAVSGRVLGDIDVVFHTLGTPGKVDVRVWPDIESLTCNDGLNGPQDFPEPAGEAVVDLPAGEAEIRATIEGVDFLAEKSLLFQINPTRTADVPVLGTAIIIPPFVSRVFYDATTAPSAVTFTCIPERGTTSCTT